VCAAAPWGAVKSKQGRREMGPEGPVPRNMEFELGLATPNPLLGGRERERESGMFPEACIRPSTGIVASLFKLMHAGRSVALF
jgi:hypothetical protein